MDVNMKPYEFGWSIAKQNEVQLNKLSAKPQSGDSMAISDWMRGVIECRTKREICGLVAANAQHT